MHTHEELLAYLLKIGDLKSPAIVNAFRAIKRFDFIPENLTNLAYKDMALPIGHGATISQPRVVAFMLELLQPQPNAKILDIGSGSGWTTALLAQIVSQNVNSKSQIPNAKQIQSSKLQIPNGKIIAIEVVPELKTFGEQNCAKYNFVKRGIAKFLCQNGREGLLSEAPFDAIHVAAALQRKTNPFTAEENILRDIPNAWKNQLKIGGKIVTPINNSIWEFLKTANGFKAREYPGFAFVPLIKHK